MRSTLRSNCPAFAAGLAALGLALAGCASDGVYAYGPPAPYASVAYSGYYDGYYGPFVGGYWGPGSIFYYLDRSTGRYHRDDGRHFRREARPGFNPIHGQAPPPADGRPHPRRPGQSPYPQPQP